METREEQLRSNSAALGQVLVPSLGLHIALSLSCLADVETSNPWRN